MTAINHAVFGALIVTVVPNPYLAIPLALASHFLLDALPHFGINRIYLIMKILLVDVLLVAIFLGILAADKPAHWLLMIVCVIVAMSPDLMWAPNAIRRLNKEKTKKLNLVMTFHSVIQWGEKPWGMAIEVPWLILTSILLVKSV